MKRTNKLTVLSIVFIFIGVIFILIKGFTPSYLDAQDMLIEPYFFLIPLGFSSIFLGLILGTVSFIQKMTKQRK